MLICALETGTDTSIGSVACFWGVSSEFKVFLDFVVEFLVVFFLLDCEDDFDHVDFLASDHFVIPSLAGFY